MFRINLLGGTLFKTPMSCACFRDGSAIAAYLLMVGPAPVSGGEPNPFVVLTGESAGNVFGISVSGAGDVNDDGFDDVIVGADFRFSGGLGRAYVFFGGSEADAAVDLTLNGEAGISRFGCSVSGAGDMNGDSFDDVIVGAASSPDTDPGRAYLFFGGPGADEIADLVLLGEGVGDGFGASVSKIGDFNDDGFDDLVVGAPSNDAPGSNAGRAYVFFGGASLDANADVIFNAEEANDSFGYSVSEAGDVNGDGFKDALVGAPTNEYEAGRAYVYYGGPGFDALADLTLTENIQFPGFAEFVSGAVDVNGDGFDEIIVGHFYGEKVRIYYGIPQPDATPTPDLILTAEAIGDFFGDGVSGAGDLNGDSYGDVIVGAVGNDAGGIDAGRAYIYLGGETPDTIADLMLTGESAGDRFGVVSGAGDFNGDSYDDVIVGAFFNDYAGQDAGRAYVYLGGSQLTAGDFTGVDVDSPAPGNVMVSPPRPNPLVGSGTAYLQFELNLASPVRMLLQDIQGRTVAEREREFFTDGTHSVSWNPGELPSGVYYLRIEAGGDAVSTKLVIVR